MMPRPERRRLRSFFGARGRQVSSPHRVNLALQGGGVYGAFTWGVLDHLLEDGRLEFDGISGASAGAVNAVLLADGLQRGGPKEARSRLSEFWHAISIAGSGPPLPAAALDALLSGIDGATFDWMAAYVGLFSPYEVNPFQLNPLSDLIRRLVDFEGLRSDKREIFIGATEVETGAQKVFERNEICLDAVLASACLPALFPAIEIGGVLYWDGGYSCNPPLLPFLRRTDTDDVLIVQINPVVRKGAPTSRREILARENEIIFNSPLQSEIHAIQEIGRMIGHKGSSRWASGLRAIRLHRIALQGLGRGGAVPSKLRNDLRSIELLRDAGIRAAQIFLAAHGSDIGMRATLSDSKPTFKTLSPAAQLACV